MASAPPVPTPQGAAPQQGNPAFQIFAVISQLSQQMAKAIPATSPMAEEIQNQVKLALQTAIQSQAPQQQAPPI